jgi:hypothetical protein
MLFYGRGLRAGRERVRYGLHCVTRASAGSVQAGPEPGSPRTSCQPAGVRIARGANVGCARTVRKQELSESRMRNEEAGL